MKVTLLILALVGLSFGVPSPRKVFHEHLNDFMKLIAEEQGDELVHIMEHYQEFEEFNIALEYLRTKDFKNLVYEMESIPEFQAVVEFLENDNIDITYIIDNFNDMLENNDELRTKLVRHELSGTDFAAFITDAIDLLPLDKLRALFEQKKEEYEDFRVAVDNLQSEEFNNILNNLWNNEVFKSEIQTLIDHHIDVDAIVKAWNSMFE